MTIAAASLIAPNGPIALVMFPGFSRKQLTTLVAARIANAANDARIAPLEDAATTDEDEAKVDRMTRALALHTILIEDVYPRMLVEPNSVNVAEKGSSTYTDKQRQGILDMAQRYLDAFDGELTVEVDPAEQWGAGVAVRGS